MSMENNFKKERDRLGISQEKIADVCNVTRQGVYKWDKGGSIPFEKLLKLVPLGFDIQFIITGVRSSNLNRVQEESSEPVDSSSIDARLSRLTDTQQDVIKLMLEELERADERTKLAKDLAKQVRENGNGKK